MYDLPEVRDATDAWWRSIANALCANGIGDVPARLSRDTSIGTIWRDPGLVLTQTCGYPLKFEFADTLRAVAVPAYRAEGCDGSSYSSALIVRDTETGSDLLDFANRRFAANSRDSQSGYNCVRAMLADASAVSPFFEQTVWTGGHRLSLAALRENRADIAAIDGVTLALLRRNATVELDGLKIIGFSPATPGLPYATRINVNEVMYSKLQDALLMAADDATAATARDALLIDYVELIDTPEYEPIATMHERGSRYGRVARDQ